MKPGVAVQSEEGYFSLLKQPCNKAVKTAVRSRIFNFLS